VEIADPYAMLHNYRLYYLTYVWVWTRFPFAGYWLAVPVWYGSDYYLYCRYAGEPSQEAVNYYLQMREWLWVEKQLHEQFITYFTAAGNFFVLSGMPEVASVLYGIAAIQWAVSEAWYDQSWKNV